MRLPPYHAPLHTGSTDFDPILIRINDCDASVKELSHLYSTSIHGLHPPSSFNKNIKKNINELQQSLSHAQTSNTHTIAFANAIDQYKYKAIRHMSFRSLCSSITTSLPEHIERQRQAYLHQQSLYKQKLSLKLSVTAYYARQQHAIISSLSNIMTPIRLSILSHNVHDEHSVSILYKCYLDTKYDIFTAICNYKISQLLEDKEAIETELILSQLSIKYNEVNRLILQHTHPIFSRIHESKYNEYAQQLSLSISQLHSFYMTQYKKTLCDINVIHHQHKLFINNINTHCIAGNVLFSLSILYYTNIYRHKIITYMHDTHEWLSQLKSLNCYSI